MHIVIIGNGIAGITAARHIRKRCEHKITVVSGESEHFFSRPALMYLYMGHMTMKHVKPYEDWFWANNKIDLIHDWVAEIDTDNKHISFKNGGLLSYDKLIIASGSSPNKFGWPGQNLDNVSGLYSLQDLQKIESASPNLERAVIVGGGLIGIELAEMFHSRHIPVTFLVREESFWNNVLPNEESKMINRHIIEQGIDLRLKTELDSILDDGTGKVKSVKTGDGEIIDCQFVGLTAGVHPNIDFIRNSSLKTNRGILVDQYLQTSEPNVYAIGDCAELEQPQSGRRAIEAVWYTGRMMGETIAKTICETPTAYQPGLWFNSAKFFDIEYQVYGTINPKPAKNIGSIYWEHPSKPKSIRLNFDKNTAQILGFNLMGIRYRHEVCEKWLKQKTHIETVLSNLSLANFDPEFFKLYEAQLIELYNQEHQGNLRLESSSKLNKVLEFLGV